MRGKVFILFLGTYIFLVYNKQVEHCDSVSVLVNPLSPPMSTYKFSKLVSIQFLTEKVERS